MNPEPIWFQPPPPPSRPPAAPSRPDPALVDLVIDGQPAKTPDGATILEACRARGIDIPTLCYLPTLTPVNVCRVCVVEVTGSRVLVPACSRRVEPGMTILTESERVRVSRRMVLELLASSVDLSTAPGVDRLIARYGARADRYGPPGAPAAAGERDAREPGHHEAPDGARSETVAQPAKIDNDLYMRDYSKCILCYKCVEACGVDAQNTFAIAVAGRGFDARISTEADVPLPDSACVYCGNCIGVCPTGALMFKREHDMRAAGHVGRVEAANDRHDLPLLRRGLHALAHRPGQPDREGDLAGRRLGDRRSPLHQGPLRLHVHRAARRRQR